MAKDRREIEAERRLGKEEEGSALGQSHLTESSVVNFANPTAIFIPSAVSPSFCTSKTQESPRAV